MSSVSVVESKGNGSRDVVDLDRMLRITRETQWSVHQFDWDRPLEGADDLSSRERKELGLMLVFTAGLEYQAAEIFRLCARYVGDSRAKQIYEYFYVDEMRHARSEIAMAKRLGVSWQDMPLLTRLNFRAIRHIWQSQSRFLHEVTASQIVLFEIGLDGLLIPLLKEKVKDSLQDEVFRRIDVDESHHLAMDYWLLDRKGKKSEKADLKFGISDLMELAIVAPLAPLGLWAIARATRHMQAEMFQPERIRIYWDRVKSVPSKAPHAMDYGVFRRGLRGQKVFMNFLRWAAANKKQRGYK
ncbi:MAG: hypothetical protein KDH09_09765 [Chrysiogenetes bacterium]|nr:hypothetical protein [Chrysiogenetes bacterium]